MTDDEDFYEDDEPLEDLLAAFERGEKTLTMPPDWDRTIRLDYRRDGQQWVATSADLTGFSMRGDTLDGVREAVRADLGPYIDDTVRLVENVHR